MQYQGAMGFRRSIGVVLLALTLIGCAEGGEGLVNETEITLTGSVGDGPVVGASVAALDFRGKEVVVATGDASTNYELVVPPKTRFPLTVTATGGTDLVTGQPLDLTLRSTLLDPAGTRVNLSPLSTLVSRIANCRQPGKMRQSTIDEALADMPAHFAMGLDPARVPDSLFGAVSATNIADIVFANEALAESIRRTHAALAGTSSAGQIDELVDDLGCDVADGGGVNASKDVDTRTLAAFHAATAGVLLETIAGTLRVNGTDAMGPMDASIQQTMPQATATVANVPVNPALATRARKSLAVLNAVFDDPEITDFMVLLGQTSAAQMRSAIRAALDTSAQNTFDGLPERAALADTTELTSMRDAVQALETAAPPNLSLSVNPTTVNAGGTALLSWASTAAQSCVASGGWSGSQPVEGTFTTNAINSATSFTLDCVGLGGTTSNSVTVNVQSSTPAPTVSISANPTQINAGSSSNLSWSSTNATSCTASGAWSGSRGTSGTVSTGNLSTTSSFTLTCTGAGGSANATATVTVNPAPTPAPTLTFTGNPTSVAYNGTSTLNWSTTDATSCTASGDWSGSRAVSGSSAQSNLTANRSYTLTCQGPGGSVARTVNVTVAPAPAPTLTFTANPTSVAYNGSSTLNWSATNATSCTASGGWSGTQNTSGSSVRNNLTASTSFTLACTGAGGTVNQTVNVTVAPAPAPTLTFTANPTSVAYNGSSTLNWTSTNATSCTASGGWSGTQATSGSSVRNNLTANATYTLACTGAGGTVNQTVNVTVAAPTPTLTFTASPTSVAYNGSSTLNWSSTNVTSCTASGDWSGAQATSGSSVRSNLTANQSYTLSCTGAGGTVNQTATVTVAPAGAPTLTLTVNPTSVAYNGSTTVSWSSTNATSCTASGGWTGTKSTSGSETRSNLTANTTFTLACTGAGGSVTQNASVTVAAAPPTVTLTASPTWVAPNTNSTLTWSSTNTTSCTASSGWSGTKATSGSQSVGPLTQDTTYSLSCTGAGGSAVSMASVSVRSAQLSWTAPTQNVDGSALTNLAGYKIYTGTSASNLSLAQTINSPTTTQATLTLTPGTWHFALTAFNTLNEESAKTNSVSKTVQ